MRTISNCHLISNQLSFIIPSLNVGVLTRNTDKFRSTHHNNIIANARHVLKVYVCSFSQHTPIIISAQNHQVFISQKPSAYICSTHTHTHIHSYGGCFFRYIFFCISAGHAHREHLHSAGWPLTPKSPQSSDCTHAHTNYRILQCFVGSVLPWQREMSSI